jgi:hypothetical protein
VGLAGRQRHVGDLGAASGEPVPGRGQVARAQRCPYEGLPRAAAPRTFEQRQVRPAARREEHLNGLAAPADLEECLGPEQAGVARGEPGRGLGPDAGRLVGVCEGDVEVTGPDVHPAAQAAGGRGGPRAAGEHAGLVGCSGIGKRRVDPPEVGVRQAADGVQGGQHERPPAGVCEAQRPVGVGDRRGETLEVALGEREARDDIEAGS